MRRSDELESFKRDINLSAYAASCGFRLDKGGTSRNSILMRHISGEKIIIAMARDGHWVYFSVHDLHDSGSIVDFVQNRRGGSIGDVRIELRPWLEGRAVGLPEPEAYVPSLEPISRNLVRVRAQYASMTPVTGRHLYLEGRGIPREILEDVRFHGKILVDERHNAVFPHYNEEGLCGFELKNRNFTSFAPGGEKGLWGSRLAEDDQILVICETAIDALSYAALHETRYTRFISTAGALNPAQPELIGRAMRKLPDCGEIVAALDNDEGGDLMLEKIRGIFQAQGLQEDRLRVHRPKGRGEDWNDVLKAHKAQEAPSRRVKM